MRVSQISIENYCGARSLSVPCKEPVVMFVGDNGAGKSSIKEGIRHALFGVPTRVGTRKDDAAALVSDGARVGKAYVGIAANGKDAGAIVSVPDGERKLYGFEVAPDQLVMDCVTDAHVFAGRMSGDERRMFLFELLGVQVTPESVGALLVRRGCDSYYAEQAAAMIYGGFPAACEYAKDRAKEARGIWRSITGETYGMKKAETWKSSLGEPYDSAAHVADIERDGRIADAIANVRAEVAALELAADFSGACPHCGGVVALKDGVLVEHDGRDLGNDSEIAAKYDELGKLREQEKAVAEAIHAHEARKHSADTCARATEAASAAHDEIKAWVQIAEHLMPEGVPAELLAQALTPINEAMSEFAAWAGWNAPRLDANCAVRIEDRPYALLSESEQWRVDALATFAIAKISGARFAMFDRFDVLDMTAREELLALLDHVVTNAGLVDTVLLFGTLKTTPPSEPGFMQVHRIENGAIKGD